MKPSILTHYALSLCIAAGFLAACGRSQPPIGAPGAMPQSRAIATHAKRAGSWMPPRTSGDLIYATGACGGTCVLSYPGGSLVQSLNVGQNGICDDGSGNVYIAGGGQVLYEYAHGGSSPTNTYSVSGGEINSCSIDPLSGNVAVTVVQMSGYDVAVFPSGGGSPVTYLVNDFAVEYCGYDNGGDLFVDGYPGGYPEHFGLVELPQSASQFQTIEVSPEIEMRPGQVRWDGKYVTIEGIGIRSGVALYQLSISGSTATIAHTTKFKGVSRAALASWIQGNMILIPYGTRGNGVFKTKVGIWKYPAGGKASQKISHFSKNGRPDIQAVTFSPG